jgi:SpoVK/Ycf46/Vps4 family AAA+-type ATPase
MATAEQLKALLKSHLAGDEEQFRSIALQIAAYTAKKGNTQLAQELKSILDEARIRHAQSGLTRAVPIARPAGELASLITASYPATRLGDMVLRPLLQETLAETVRQYRQRHRLREHGLSPKRKLLLIGPPGSGKTMTASAIAGECGLPLLFVQLHSLITKYMGETAAKLHLVFDAMVQTRGVYLFDEFDAIGATRSMPNDVGEIRRILNSFLQFLERDDSDSIVVAATNFAGMLDQALFRRFDDVIRYSLPSPQMAKALIQNRLSSFDARAIVWRPVLDETRGLSHGEITRACDDAAKAAVLADSTQISTALLKDALRVRRQIVVAEAAAVSQGRSRQARAARRR